MGGDRFERLTPRQRQCLRLVRDLQSTKQTAITLGIKPATVNGYLDDAVALIGARDRRSAALAFAEFEKAAPDKLGGDSIRFEPSDDERPSAPTGSDGNTIPLHSVREERAQFGVDQSQVAARPPSLPWSVKGSRNALSVGQRLFWCMTLAIAMLIAFGSLVAAIEGIGRIGWAVHRQ